MHKITNSIEKEIKADENEKDDLDLEYNIDTLTGERKNLSSALFDVKKERGIDTQGLLYLIKSLPDLETFLYYTSVRKYYRDYTEHALRVAVLGDFLLDQEIEQGMNKRIISDLTGIEIEALKEEFWWIMGLLHDIGYPLAKISDDIKSFFRDHTKYIRPKMPTAIIEPRSEVKRELAHPTRLISTRVIINNLIYISL